MLAYENYGIHRKDSPVSESRLWARCMFLSETSAGIRQSSQKTVFSQGGAHRVEACEGLESRLLCCLLIVGLS